LTLVYHIGDVSYLFRSSYSERDTMTTSRSPRKTVSITLDRVKSEIERILPDMVKVRHTLHQNPEIALGEFDTSTLIRKVLKEARIEVLKPFLETDVVAMVRGKRPGRNVTLRADIDALPLIEKTGLPYASKRQGFMHACGHDGHTAMVLGAALLLNKLKEDLSGSVRFVFQPGEEIVAAGKQLVDRGALRDPRPDAVFAVHAWAGMPVGAVASKPGALLAASDFFKIEVKGKGAHGSRPEDSIDPILTAARIIESLQSVVSREVSSSEPAVLSVCRIAGGTNGNVIPDCVEIEGTTRYLKPELKQKMARAIKRIVKGVCDSMGASFSLKYDSPYIPTINDEAMVALGKKVALRVLGRGNWFDLTLPSMGAEDFSYYLRKHPGAMFRLGVGEKSAALHNSHFDFNDRAMGPGILFLVSLALEALQ
jgi:amidohydrolase